MHGPYTLPYSFVKGAHFFDIWLYKMKSRRPKWTGHVARTGMTQNMYKISVTKPLEISSLLRCRRRLADDIKVHLDEIGVAGG
jgi:hypothetical protein